MDITKFNITRLDAGPNGYNGRIIASQDWVVALFLDSDDEYWGVLFGGTAEQIRDIVRFMEYNPDKPDVALCRKYGITPGDDIFGGVMHWETWFDALRELGVIRKNQTLESYNECSFEEAFRELF